jgi:hypothetical protein
LHVVLAAETVESLSAFYQLVSDLCLLRVETDRIDEEGSDRLQAFEAANPKPLGKLAETTIVAVSDACQFEELPAREIINSFDMRNDVSLRVSVDEGKAYIARPEQHPDQLECRKTLLGILLKPRDLVSKV